MKDKMVINYGRTAGILLVISIIAGGFGEAYVPSVFLDWKDNYLSSYGLV